MSDWPDSGEHRTPRAATPAAIPGSVASTPDDPTIPSVGSGRTALPRTNGSVMTGSPLLLADPGSPGADVDRDGFAATAAIAATARTGAVPGRSVRAGRPAGAS